MHVHAMPLKLVIRAKHGKPSKLPVLSHARDRRMAEADADADEVQDVYHLNVEGWLP